MDKQFGDRLLPEKTLAISSSGINQQVVERTAANPVPIVNERKQSEAVDLAALLTET